MPEEVVAIAGRAADIDHVGWRRRPRTLNEELLAEAPRGTWRDDAGVDERDSVPRPATGRRIALTLPLLAAWLALHFVSEWGQVVIGALAMAELLRIFLRSTKKGVRSAKFLGGVLHVWLATCVLATVLFGLDGFQQDEKALLGLLWPILGLIWIAYRLRRARATPRPETGSGGQ